MTDYVRKVSISTFATSPTSSEECLSVRVAEEEVRRSRTKRPGHLMIIHANANTTEFGQAKHKDKTGLAQLVEKALQLGTPKNSELIHFLKKQ